MVSKEFRSYFINYLILFNFCIFAGKTIKRNYCPAIRKIQRTLLQECIDESIKPCENFWKYSCGNWWKTQISTESSSFNALQTIFEDIPLMINVSLSDAEYFSMFQDDHPVNKAKTYYESCMDIETMTYRGWHPVFEFLSKNFKIPGVSNKKKMSLKYDWIKVLSFLRLYGDQSIIKTMVDKNLYNSDMYTLYLDQPDKDINLLTDDSCYGVFEIFERFNVSEETANLLTDDVCEFEYELQMLCQHEKDRPYLNVLYTNVSVVELNKLFKNLNLQRFIMLIRKKSFDLSEKVFINFQYLQNLDKLLLHTNPRTITAYVIMKFILFVARDYIREDDGNDFDTLDGEDDWWKKCVQATITNMDMAVANIFVRKFLRSHKRVDVNNLVVDIKHKFGEILKSINWVDSETRQKLIEKFENMYIEIGFPQFILKRSDLKKWFQGIEIDKANFFKSSMELIKLNKRRELKLIGNTTKKELYDTGITRENAVYDMQANKITITAGILQLPYYHPAYPGYMKYGVIGAIVGHEFFHAFDNFGREHNSKGNLENWWTENSLREYNKRADCLIKQYDDLGAFGKFSLSENIADNGGLKVAYLAYMDWLNRNKNNSNLIKRETIKGVNLTKEQLFFVAFAQWRCMYTNQEHSVQNLNDPHPKEHIRVIGALSNSENFGYYFKCNVGDKLNPLNKCQIW